MKSYVYLHGFASSSASSKARFFSARLAQRGVTLAIPELDGGDFEHLTLSGQLAILQKLAADGPSVLLGSSLGGYIAALYAEQHVEVERLVLLAPAFDFHQRWAERLGARTIKQWKEHGSRPVLHYGTGRERSVAYALYDDAKQYPAYPNVGQPTLVLQGLHDDVVLPETAKRYCDRNASATLHLFDSGHELTNVLEEIWAVTEPFLFP